LYASTRDRRFIVPKWSGDVSVGASLKAGLDRTINFGNWRSYLTVILVLAPSVLIGLLVIPALPR
ncbi:MAG: hypothetical protein AABZ80_13120, partial [Gemmatimonadota bacterium]